jgi:hypothetical protein
LKRVILLLASLVLMLGTAVPTAQAVAPATSALATDRWLGFYQSEAGTTFGATLLTTREAQVAKHPAVVNFYIADSSSFPLSRCQTIAAHGSLPMVTLEFWSTQTGGVSTITNGSKDAYLIAFADAAKAYGGEVWLRPFHEMNSNWYPWAGATAGNSAAKVVAAWNHVRQVFASRGATNVKFVWCVNNESVPNTPANSIQSYWPGDANVDLLAIDGYNFGTSASWSTWRSFGSVMGSSYAAVTALSAKPLFLAETGCVEQGGNKAAWISGMFASLSTTYPRIAGVCWFNVNDTTANTDWRIDSSPGSLAAFNAAIGGSDDGIAPPSLTTAASSITIGSNLSRVLYPRAFELSGVLTPGGAGDPCVVYVRKPRTSRWSYSSARLAYASDGSGGGKWWYRYTPRLRGTYYFQVRFAGDAGRLLSRSRTIAVAVR